MSDLIIVQALRKFTRTVDEAGDWFYHDEISPHQRTKQATSTILRAINKLNEDCFKNSMILSNVLYEMYLLHVGRSTKKLTKLAISLSNLDKQ